MSIHEDLDSTDLPSGSSKYFRDGNHIVKILRVKDNPNARNGSYVHIETQVLWTNSDHPAAPRAGARGTQTITMSGKLTEMGKGNWKKFICDMLSIRDPNTVDPNAWGATSRDIVGDAAANIPGAFDGQICTLETAANSKDTYTVHTWAKAVSEDLERVGLDPALLREL